MGSLLSVARLAGWLAATELVTHKGWETRKVLASWDIFGKCMQWTHLLLNTEMKQALMFFHLQPSIILLFLAYLLKNPK